MSADDRPRLGVIGGGEVALKAHLPVLLAARRVRVAYVVDASDRAVKQARRMYGLPGEVASSPAVLDRLPEVDFALVTVPVGAREPYYRHLAARGVSVYAEKPVATTGAALERLRDLFAEDRFACGLQRRFHANVRLMVEAVRDGWFGALRGIQVREGARTTATGVDASFRDSAELGGGGILIDLGTHAIDVIHMLVPDSPIEVVEQKIVFDEGIDRDVRLRLEVGEVDVGVELTWLRPIGTTIRIDFDRCSLLTSAAPSAEVRVLDRHGAHRSTLSAHEGATTPPDALARAWACFLESRAAGENPLGLDSVAPTVRLIERVYGEAAHG